MVKGFEEVKTHSEVKDIQIVDCRPASMYAEAKIPNSININGTDFQNDNGTIKTDDQIRTLFEQAGVDVTKPMVFTCNSGIKATIAINAAQQIGAKTDSSVFDGSWSEWSARI